MFLSFRRFPLSSPFSLKFETLSLSQFLNYSTLSYLFLLKKNTHGYLYITFKHYSTKQINKKEHYCIHKVRVMSSYGNKSFNCLLFGSIR